MRQFFSILAAVVAGFIGGYVGSRLTRPHESSQPEQVIRARSFELINDAGQVSSYWGVDKGKNVVLVFGSERSAKTDRNHGDAKKNAAALDAPDDQRTAIGLMPSGSGFLTLRGADGKTRVRLYLSEYDKPYLLLEDETGPRVSLGHEQTDTPSPNDNDWALNFHPDRASIGMYARQQGAQTFVQGFLSVSHDKLKFP
jgi:hypothetical protein